MTRDVQASTIILSGDVMVGRGVDQILPHPGEPILYESYLKDARDYVWLAERKNGPIPYPVNETYIWGEAMDDLMGADVRIINLETSITGHNKPVKKGINYRMHPHNVCCLRAADINCCILANNHVMDWSEAGLLETLETLDREGIGHTGAGSNIVEAAKPCVLPVAGKGRILVFAYGFPSSGIPTFWAATEHGPGINLLPDLSHRHIGMIQEQVIRHKEPGDIVIISLHWGGNWGYDISDEQVEFAHNLVDHADADIIHGHSSHHFKAMEVYRGKLILYGCGDLINDYEGISGHKSFREELGLLYLATVNHKSGELESLQLTPTLLKKMKIHNPSGNDLLWTRDVLNRECKTFGLYFSQSADSKLDVHYL